MFSSNLHLFFLTKHFLQGTLAVSEDTGQTLIMHQSFVTTALVGLGIAGPSFDLNIVPQCHGTVGFLISCQTGRSKFTFICQNLSRTIKVTLQCWTYT